MPSTGSILRNDECKRLAIANFFCYHSLRHCATFSDFWSRFVAPHSRPLGWQKIMATPHTIAHFICHCHEHNTMHSAMKRQATRRANWLIELVIYLRGIKRRYIAKKLMQTCACSYFDIVSCVVQGTIHLRHTPFQRNLTPSPPPSTCIRAITPSPSPIVDVHKKLTLLGKNVVEQHCACCRQDSGYRRPTIIPLHVDAIIFFQMQHIKS